MKCAVLAALVALTLLGCRDDAKRADGTPSSTLAGSVTPSSADNQAGELDALRGSVPSGWALAHWWISSDGAYFALDEVGLASRTHSPLARSVSVYHRSGGMLTELARADSPSYFDQVLVTPSQGVLDPDALGTRRLTVAFGSSGAPSSTNERTTSITIARDGTVAVDEQGASGAGTPVAASTPSLAPLATITTSHRTQDGSPTVTVSAPASAVPAGWTLADSAWSPDAKHVAVVTSPASGLGFVEQLSVYALSETGLRELWREVNAFVTIDHALAYTDVKGDGAPDLVYSTSTGSNGWTQTATLAATLEPDGTMQDVSFRLPPWPSAPERAVDLNHDGVYEWLVSDASWELQGFCHACSPSSQLVLAWDGSAYVDASQRFSQAIIGAGDDPTPPQAAGCMADDAYLSQMVARYLAYFNAGDQQDAQRIRGTLAAFQPTPQLVAKRDAIVATLSQVDPHHPGAIPDIICTP